MKIKIEEYKTNGFGEIEKSIKSKIWFEELDINSFEELLNFEKLINVKKQVNVRYENGNRYISIVGPDFRRYIKII